MTMKPFMENFRGYITEKFSYDLTFYRMKKRDDIITYRDPDNPNLSIASQNGETLHKGVELSLNWDALDEWSFSYGGSFGSIVWVILAFGF